MKRQNRSQINDFQFRHNQLLARRLLPNLFNVFILLIHKIKFTDNVEILSQCQWVFCCLLLVFHCLFC